MSHPFRPIDGFKSPRFSQIATFMRLPHHRTAADLDVALLGIPYDGGTSYRPGARFGPREIRSQSALIRPWHPVLQVSPFDVLRVADYGDIDISPISIERTNELVEAEIGAVLAADCIPVAIGGLRNSLFRGLQADNVFARNRIDHRKLRERVRQRFAVRIVGTGAHGILERLEPLGAVEKDRVRGRTRRVHQQ